MRRFNLKKWIEVEGEEQFVETSYRFWALENFQTEADINRAWETVRENIKTLAKKEPRLLWNEEI
jgi:hypothetical protein